MDEQFFDKLDQLYLRYGYEPKRNTRARVYLFTKSIYNGADIVNAKSKEDADDLKLMYAQAGYAVKVRDFCSIQDAEDCLFKDFFKADGVLHNLRKRYDLFVKRLMRNLPNDAQYEYIRSPYEITSYSSLFEEANTLTVNADDEENSLVDTVINLIETHVGPLLIIIEAAAGYGKTCTAFEILSQFVSIPSKRLPFFTELSRDRKATIFKHILSFEIEEQFSNRVDSIVVIDQIKKGRIPLIIDGFDELISKDFTFSTSQFEQVESMLTTIVDLLTDNAKIIITSRKTAIFNSEEFHDWMINRNIDYALSKITIMEPSIHNWLQRDRLEIIQNHQFPVEQLSNPVLLTYLRYIDIAELERVIVNGNSVVDRYFEFLLLREQTRQNLLIEPETQLRIFRKLVRLLTEWDIKYETKDFIKELLLEYNKSILEDTKRKYTPDNRPRTDQLAEILSNHAFLDRNEKGLIGFVNEFILGTLVGQNLVFEKFQEYSSTFYEKISQSFALLAVQAYLIQPKPNRELLWIVFNSYPFPYEPEFFFKIDVEFRNEIVRNYDHATIIEFTLEAYTFEKPGQFTSMVFSGCTFVSCSFHFLAFKEVSFVNCKFYNCLLKSNGIPYSNSYFTVFGCTSDNDFIDSLFDSEENMLTEKNLEKEVLDQYFKKGNIKPRHRQLSYMRSELKDFDSKSISKVLHRLEGEGIIQFNGDLSFLTRKGIGYYNDKYRAN